jgi:nucleotide-binding universal stress UspA family protein
MTTSPTCIIAYTSEDDRLAAVRDAAIRTAKTSNARLVLYDIDAASPFAKPLPTEWSADSARDQVPTMLAVDDLERAGRMVIAEQVQAARSQGIDAYGWLPGEKGGDALADYAGQIQADLIMLPEELEDPGIIDRLRHATLEDVEENTTRPIALVLDDGEVKMI